MLQLLKIRIKKFDIQPLISNWLCLLSLWNLDRAVVRINT
ncbi:hypothetical protein RINTHH_10410 [Richelia intracellularis HH01]|uniref:Uncharacterized protein n=1 Tax=Richelia intracellularis HH01 TaxID=1165094 RepID=M1X5A6_9NOST|nr:hypothetical protein RINTHH_10410 [Richelia intracellularis HH01]